MTVKRKIKYETHLAQAKSDEFDFWNEVFSIQSMDNILDHVFHE